MKSKMINTLVIGGAGYIGAHLVSELIAADRCVTVLGRSGNPKYELPPGVTYIAGDFSQLNLVGDLLDTHQEVIHLAYATTPNVSFENPLSDLLHNVSPTIQLFSEIANRGTKLILVSSGGTVYGEAEKLPISETHSTKPISPYGVTKLTLEKYAYLYAATHGLRFICVRPANAYGIGQNPFSGQGFIATAMKSVLRNIPIKIFGENGTIRDYLYVSDLAKGVVSALQQGRLFETYNIGSGVGLSNLDVIDMLKPLMSEIGREVQVEILPERKFDVRVNVLDSTKLQIDTGWSQKIEFERGLKITRDWLLKQ